MKRLIVTLALGAALTGCINRPIVSIPPASCARLIPAEWAEGVEAAPIPDTTGLDGLAAIQAWAAAYVAMGGQLAKANGRAADTIGIVSRCEAMVNAARP